MALESFYGGKQGVSPVIKAKFKYISKDDDAYKEQFGKTTKLTQEEAWTLNAYYRPTANYSAGQSIIWTEEELKPFVMNECLKNINYIEVWYGELCIIDTDSKFNSNNGKLFRRTLKQSGNRYLGTEDTDYAEYIGQIVGPSGLTPSFDFGSLDEEREKAIGIVGTYQDDNVPLDNSHWDYKYRKEDPQTKTTFITSQVPHEINDIAVLKSGVPAIDSNGIANIQMVPGREKDSNGFTDTYHNEIRYTWCNVHRRYDKDHEEDAWIYLGFEIPYTVYNVTGTEENYTYAGNIFEDNSPNDHPFYKEYNFHIPRGARGIGPEEVFIVGKDGKTKPTELHSFDSIQYNQNTDTYNVKSNSLIEPSEKTYWVAKWKLYNPKTENIQEIYQYLGSYRDIVRATLNTDDSSPNYGQFTVTYSDNDNNPFTTNIPLIKNISYNGDENELTFSFSNDKNITVNLDNPGSGGDDNPIFSNIVFIEDNNSIIPGDNDYVSNPKIIFKNISTNPSSSNSTFITPWNNQSSN